MTRGPNPKKSDGAPRKRDTPAPARSDTPDSGLSVQQLATELKDARASLTTTADELAAANEQLTSANEELQCANEELQTSREELLTLNEQLESVNAELRGTIDELSTANSDLQNLFAATQIATIFLDRDLRIVKFTPAATALVSLLGSDVGRPLADLSPRFSGGDVVADAQDVLRTLTPVERQVRAVDTGRWFILRVMPYRTVHDVVVGVVVTFVDVTELRRAEEALRTSEARLNKAQEIAHLGSWELDLVENRLSWSDEVYRIFGLQPQEFRATYEAFLDAVHPDDRAAVDAAYSGSLREGRDSYEIEHRVVRKSTGEIRIVHEKCEHLRNAAGEIIASVGMVHDVTDRKRAEAVVAESRRRTNTILESITDCCFELDGESRFTYVNERALSFFGRPVEDFLGRCYRDVFPAAVGSMIESHCRRAIAEQRAMHFEAHSVVFDRWAEFHAYPSGKSLAVYFRDITDRKRAEETRRVSEARLQTIVDNLTEGLVVSDTRGAFLHWNPAALEMHGFASMEQCRKHLAELTSLFELATPEGRILPLDEWPLARILRGERLRELEIEVRRRQDGTSRIFNYGGDLARDADGQPLLAVVSVTDVTERKRAEQSLREANDRLREADRHKNEFLAVLSHELRNPLAPIRHSLFVLERSEPGGEQAAFAQAVIDRQVKQLARLVDDLLDVTRVSRNKIELKREPLDFAEVVRRTADDLRSVFEQNRVHFETAVPETPIAVTGDRERLAQVVGNLLQNAAKFTPADGRVRISLDTNAATRQAVLIVADNGVGMDPEVVARLFQPFMQADHTLERSKGGLGLGLALVKGLIDLHGGEVTAHSDGPGKGSVFTVRLALAGTAPVDTRMNRMATASRSRRVLVIEDNTDAAESLREMLQCMGHTVTITHDGFDGLAMSRTFRPDVILCDIGLPGMNGYEVARALRADPQMTGVRLIAISGYALPEDLQRTAEAGFDEHLAKPPSPEKLASLLEGVPVVGQGL